VHTGELSGTGSSHVHDLPLTRAAFEFAAERHEGQLLAGEHAPFVQHPFEVASLLSGAGYADAVVASGVLHDVLESTDTPAIELEHRFGATVAALVQAVSEDATIVDRRARKSALRAQVAEGPVEAAAIFAADKLSRVRELRSPAGTDLPNDEVARKLDHYRASLSMLEWRLGRGHRLVEPLRVELKELEELVTEAPRTL
jgi:(p)ppGpp synthase/HD superfamily hydrolase